MDPDVLVLATDAGQELSQLELATIAAARHHNTQLDHRPHQDRPAPALAAHPRRQRRAPAPSRPVGAGAAGVGSAATNSAGSATTRSLSNESGVVSAARLPRPGRHRCPRGVRLLAGAGRRGRRHRRPRRRAAGRSTSCSPTPKRPSGATSSCSQARDRIERLKGGGAKWRERLYDGLERLQMETDYDLRGRMTRLQTEALEEIEAIDPAASWPVFSTRLERLVDDEVTLGVRGAGRQQQGPRQRRRPAVRRRGRLRPRRPGAQRHGYVPGEVAPPGPAGGHRRRRAGRLGAQRHPRLGRQHVGDGHHRRATAPSSWAAPWSTWCCCRSARR